MGQGFWFKCPKCKNMGIVDHEQAMGAVSIQCPTSGCDFHETGRVSPLITSETPTRPEDAPSQLLKGEVR